MSRLIVVENFYREPARVRQRAFLMEYVKPPELTGWRTQRGYVPRGLARRLETVIGGDINLDKPDGTPYDNGVYFMSFSKGTRREVPGVHFDEPLKHSICIVYLTADVPVDCGTSFYRHKRTRLETAPTERDARRLNYRRRDLLDLLELDSQNRNKWTEVDRVGYKFNRAVIFPARRFHAATGHFGGSLLNGRVYQLFSFRTGAGF